MQELAGTLAVSASTVSRALRGDPRISPATRQRVVEAAERLGFCPDPGAANLVAHRWQRQVHAGTLNVAHLHRPGSSEAKRDYPLLKQAAARAGITLDSMAIETPKDLPPLRRILQNRGISGVLVQLQATRAEASLFQELAGHFPLLVANHRQNYEIGPSIVRDAFHRVRDAMIKVFERGYRRMALVIPASREPASSELIDQMEAAWLLVRHQYRQRLMAKWLRYYDQQFPDYDREIRAHRFEAIIGFDDTTALSLQAQGIRMPRDIGFASMASRSEYYAGLTDSMPVVIEKSIDLLATMMRARQTGMELLALRHEIRAAWQEGASLPDRSDADRG